MTPATSMLKSKKVSLSGKTRLTYMEASALLAAALEGFEDMRVRDDADQDREEQRAAERAIDKLKAALAKIGGYNADGTFNNPFRG